MKTAVYFLFTVFISSACLMAALGAKHPVILYVIGFGIWSIFALGQSRRNQRKLARRNGEQLFRHYMRAQFRK